VARGYARVVPQPVRVGIRNFFQNLLAPIRVVNSLLQGRFHRGAVETGRFMINSTVGLLGFLDVAQSQFQLDAPEEEDFGQTLARFGIGDGIYLVLPFLGPSSLRDGAGRAVDAFLNPLFYLRELESIGAYTLDHVNATSLRLGDYESIKKSALDPYESFKNIYLQYRKERIRK
jgi:phospholipid-binding lipoprotein MlaA